MITTGTGYGYIHFLSTLRIHSQEGGMAACLISRLIFQHLGNLGQSKCPFYRSNSAALAAQSLSSFSNELGNLTQLHVTCVTAQIGPQARSKSHDLLQTAPKRVRLENLSGYDCKWKLAWLIAAPRRPENRPNVNNIVFANFRGSLREIGGAIFEAKCPQAGPL